MCFICTHIAFWNFSGQLRETASCLPSHPTSQTSCRLPLWRTCSCLALLVKVSVLPSPVCINGLRSRLYHGPHGGTLEGPVILHPGSNSLSMPCKMNVHFLILCLHPCLFAGIPLGLQGKPYSYGTVHGDASLPPATPMAFEVWQCNSDWGVLVPMQFFRFPR